MSAEATRPDAAAIAEEAFVLAYPLVVMSRTMAHAPVNTLVHRRDTPDTLRSSGWLDLAVEPVVLSVPDTYGRYYALWLRDAWNTVFATVGARTTGTESRAFALLGPGSPRTDLPAELTAITATTRTVHVTGCIEAVVATDDEVRRRAQDGFELVLLSGWHRDGAQPSACAVTDGHAPSAVEQVDRMDAREFFSEVSRLVDDNPPDLACRAALDRLRATGALSSAAPDLRASLERGVQRGRVAVRAEADSLSGGTLGRWLVCSEFDDGDDSLRRARAARSGLRLDPAADALHVLLDSDADGRPLCGSGRYVLRFETDASPPVHGFWSLTTRAGTSDCDHSVGDLRGLALDRHGALPIHIQHRPPARRRRSNWLRTPSDSFSVALHLYWPREEALDGRWTPPPVMRVE